MLCGSRHKRELEVNATTKNVHLYKYSFAIVLYCEKQSVLPDSEKFTFNLKCEGRSGNKIIL